MKVKRCVRGMMRVLYENNIVPLCWHPTDEELTVNQLQTFLRNTQFEALAKWLTGDSNAMTKPFTTLSFILARRRWQYHTGILVLYRRPRQRRRHRRQGALAHSQSLSRAAEACRMA